MCSDEGLTLETSGFESLYGGQFTLSTLGGFLKGGITLFQEKRCLISGITLSPE